ncbi:MAG: tRNA uridine(34) 5-carboxymethylaminomethyl modification radical SAM/GNAT enzyme Elp3 [Candidatus Falkowbacteria bacterium]
MAQKSNTKSIVNTLIIGLLEQNITSREQLLSAKRQLAKKNGIVMPTNTELLAALDLTGKNHPQYTVLRKLLRRRSVRTLSGVAPVAVLTMPYPCPGKCAYCPTEKDVPQSYLSNEPAVMRAIRCNYHPFTQTWQRLRALEANGHSPRKIELIVIGGTWSYLPQAYKYWYITECFRAANNFNLKKSLETVKSSYPKKSPLAKLKSALLFEQKKNERATYQIIGLTLETRPDYITNEELLEMRLLGCTRVELGVQAIDDKILALNLRGHKVSAITTATKMLRDFGFKITYHLMPGLPGATAKRDLTMFKTLFTNEQFQPDQIKFYPTVVTKDSLLYQWWQQGKYKPYSNTVLEKLIADCKNFIPPYVRIIRLIRDIPGESIIAGNTVTNLRQVMQQRGTVCHCIRCREIKEQPRDTKYHINTIAYQANSGEEQFIEAVSDDAKLLYGFCRLRLPDREAKHLPPALQNATIIRELHVYGELVAIGEKKQTQHAGLGRELLHLAEKEAVKNGYHKMAIIAGVGVRGYYRKLGYRLQQTYMVKTLS